MVHLTEASKALFDGLDPAEIFITSAATCSTAPAPDDAFRLAEVADVAVASGLAVGGKCERCWKICRRLTPMARQFCRCACTASRHRRGRQVKRRMTLYPPLAPAALRWGGIAAAVAILDQVTKALAHAALFSNPRIIEVTSFFNLVPVWNRGVSFGIFADGPEITRWLLTVFALIVSVILGLWMAREAASVGFRLGPNHWRRHRECH